MINKKRFENIKLIYIRLYFIFQNLVVLEVSFFFTFHMNFYIISFLALSFAYLYFTSTSNLIQEMYCKIHTIRRVAINLVTYIFSTITTQNYSYIRRKCRYCRPHNAEQDVCFIFICLSLLFPVFLFSHSSFYPAESQQ